MQCELCHQSDATVHFKHVVNGEVREMHLCAACSAKKGFVAQISPASLTDFLFGMDVQQKNEPVAGGEVSCPVCHLRRSDFRKTSRLGCASCYDAFAEDVKQIVCEFQKGVKHTGKVPAGEKYAGRIALLRKDLDSAIADQNFEKAALLRDSIQELESKKGGDREMARRI